MSDDSIFTPSPDEANTDKDKETKQKKQRPKSTSRKKGDVFTADDCTAKIFQLYNLLGKVLKTEGGRRKEKDFVEEGAALSRLTEKYPMVSMVMKMLDPVFFALGTLNKFGDHIGEYTARKKQAKKDRKAAETGGVTVEIGTPIQDYPTQL